MKPCGQYSPTFLICSRIKQSLKNIKQIHTQLTEFSTPYSCPIYFMILTLSGMNISLDFK